MKERTPWIIEATIQTLIAGLLLALLSTINGLANRQEQGEKRQRRLQSYLEAIEPAKLATSEPVQIDAAEVQATFATVRRDIMRTCFEDSVGGDVQAIEKLVRGVTVANHFEAKVLEATEHGGQ
jgi:hypothetical protein